MGTLTKSLLLFTMNWVDAQLTLLWIRLNVATEGNGLMARVLDHGEGSFLTVKLLIGALAAYLLYRCSHLPLAKRGMQVVLTVYAALMVLHIITGYSALGWQAPEVVAGYFGSLPKAFLALFS